MRYTFFMSLQIDCDVGIQCNNFSFYDKLLCLMLIVSVLQQQVLSMSSFVFFCMLVCKIYATVFRMSYYVHLSSNKEMRCVFLKCPLPHHYLHPPSTLHGRTRFTQIYVMTKYNPTSLFLFTYLLSHS